MFISKIQL